MTSSKSLLTISQAAKFLGISEDTLRRWERQGKFIPERTLGNSRRYDLVALQNIKNYNHKKTVDEALVEFKNELKEIREILSNNKQNNNTNSVSKKITKAPEEKKTLEKLRIITNQDLKRNIISNNTISNIVYQLKSKLIKLYNYKKIHSSSIIGFLIILLFLVIIFIVLNGLTKELKKIGDEINSKETYNQEPNISQPKDDEILQGKGIIISKDRLLVDNNGNIQLTGAISGGYIDATSNNLIVNSGLEQNKSGKALYYLYGEDAGENNAFISQDTSLDGSNSLKIIPTRDVVLKISPTYPELSSGKTYTLSLYVKSLGIVDTNILLSYGTTQKNYQISGDSSWQLITLTKTFNEKESPTLDNFTIVINANTNGGTLYLDNFQLENGTVTTAYKPSTLETDGILTVSNDIISPILADTGSLGTIYKPFKEFIVNNQTINNDLDVYGNTKIEGDLTVSGSMEFESVSVNNRLNISNDGLYTGSGIGTKRLDNLGNLLNISSLGFNYGTLTSSTDYIISSTGLAIGGYSNYYFNKNGYIKAEQINSIQDIKIGDPNGESDSLGIYFTGVSGQNNEAGVRFNVGSGKLEYRDDNTTSWTTFDSLTSTSSSNDYSASNGLNMDSNDIQLGGNLTTDTTTTLGAYDLVYNLNSTGDIDFQDSGSTILYIGDNGNIGIGTSSPTAKLDINTYTNFSSSLNVASTLTTSALKITYGAGTDKWLASDALGNAIWTDLPISTSYLAGNGLEMNGSTFDLGGSLDFSTSLSTGSYDFNFSLDGTGNTNFILSNSGDVIFKSGDTAFATFANNGSFTLDSLIMDGNTLSAASAAGLSLMDDGGNLGMFIKDEGNVGIGTTNPLSKLAVEGVGSFTLGTVDLPGIIFRDDINTGLWSSGADTINFSTNGSEMMRINSSGYVGIGTTEPTEKLALAGGNFLQTAYGNPTLKGSIATADASFGVYVSGKYAYLADEAAGLRIIDVSDPANPIALGSYDSGSNNVISVKVAGKYAYIGYFENSMSIVDVSNPYSPSLVANVALSGRARDLYVSGKYVYVAAGFAGLQIVDVSNPSLPVVTGTYSAGGNYGSGIYISGNYAYLNTYTAANSLYIINISNPTTPTLTGTYPGITTVLSGNNVYVSGKYAYIANGATGMTIINVTDPTTPTFVSDTSIGANADAIYVSGNYAYVTDSDGNLSVLNISNPITPTVIGKYDTGNGIAEGVHVAGKYAYVANFAEGLKIIDINGMETPAMYAGNIQTNDITITENGDIGNNLYVRNGLNVGQGGLYAGGPTSIMLGVGITAPHTALTVTQAGTGDILNLFDNTTEVFTVLDGGNVGIGTTNPQSKLEINGVGSFTLGTVDLPGVIFGTDTNTGLWSSGADTINLSTNGSERMRIASGGNVGIGTTDPQTSLYVYGDSAIITAETPLDWNSSGFLAISDTVSGGLFAFPSNFGFDNINDKFVLETSDATALALMGNGANGRIEFFTGGTDDTDSIERMRIASGGNVGIGTTNPQSKLEINGVGSFTLGTVDLPGVIFGTDTNTGLWSSGADTINLSTNGSERMRINSSGYVGIGTTAPESNLDISSGDGRIGFDALDNGTTWGNVITSQIASTNVGIGIGIAGDSAFNSIPRFVVNSDDTFLGYALRPGDGGTPTGSNGNGNLYINGNVGIGTTAPTAGSKLEVNGGHIRVTGGSFIDDGTTLTVPDYVFESDYQLLSLTDLQSFIDVNKHLPGIPDMNDQAGWASLSLQDRDMKLLEKTEENVSYMLYLNNQIIDLQQVNDSLSKKLSSVPLSNSGDLFIQNQIYDGLLENATDNISLASIITDSLGETKTTVGGFAKIFSGSLTTGYTRIQNLIVDTAVIRQVKVEDKLISPIVEADQILTDQLAVRKISTQKLEVKNATGDVLTSIDETGKASFKDLLVNGDATVSGSLTVKDASVSGEFYAQSARIKTLTAEKIRAESIEGLDAKLGQLVAASVSASQISLNSQQATASALPSLPDNWEASLASLMSRLDNVETASSAGTWKTNSDLAFDSQIMVGALDTDFATVNTFLGVLGTASIVNAEITNTLTVQRDLSLTQNSISTLSDTFYLQPSGLGKVDILAGAVTVESNGNLTVNGDLYLTGNLYTNNINSHTVYTEGLSAQSATVSGSLFASLIDTNGKDLAVNLGEVKGASDSAKFKVIANNEEVASIDASGSARFNALTTSKLYLPYTYDIYGNLMYSYISPNELNKNASSIGMGIIKSGQVEVFIQAPAVTKNSLIFLTPTTTITTPLAIKSKEIDKGFTVAIAFPEIENISFNWWIIN